MCRKATGFFVEIKNPRSHGSRLAKLLSWAARGMREDASQDSFHRASGFFDTGTSRSAAKTFLSAQSCDSQITAVPSRLPVKT